MCTGNTFICVVWNGILFQLTSKSPHQGAITLKMFPFDDAIMHCRVYICIITNIRVFATTCIDQCHESFHVELKGRPLNKLPSIAVVFVFYSWLQAAIEYIDITTHKFPDETGKQW